MVISKWDVLEELPFGCILFATILIVAHLGENSQLSNTPENEKENNTIQVSNVQTEKGSNVDIPNSHSSVHIDGVLNSESRV